MRLAVNESPCGCSCLAFLVWILLAALLTPIFTQLAIGMIFLTAIAIAVTVGAYVVRALRSYLERRN